MDFEPKLGFIKHEDRTEQQNAAHHAAVGVMRQFTLPIPQLAKGDKLSLTKFWNDPKVIEGARLKFDRIHQLTGSCVWAGGTNALFSSIATAAVLNKMRAIFPFTLHNYALSRHALGDDGPGDGSMGSTFAKSLEKDGVEDWNTVQNVPAYQQDDGIHVASEQVEHTWSSVRQAPDEIIVRTSRDHLLGAATPATTVQAIRALVLNGYACSFACDRFIGHGHLKEYAKPEDSVVLGEWDSEGGHQQSIHDFWEHPDLGPLYLALNNWPKQVYPIIPYQPVCSTWVTEAKVLEALRYHSEVFGLSNLQGFEPNPELTGWIL